MTNRQKKIWSLLLERDFLTARQIGERLHISDRTVRNEIKEINEELKKEAIQSKKGQGFSIADRESLGKSAVSLQMEETENLEWEVVRSVLFDEDLTYSDLADELYISDTLLTKIVARVNRRMTRHYDAGTIKKQNNHLVLNLEEREKRSYYGVYVITRNLNQYFNLEHFQTYFQYVKIPCLLELLMDELQRKNIAFYDTTIVRLLVGMAVMAERMAGGFFIEMSPDGPDNEKEPETTRKDASLGEPAIRQMVDEIGNYLGIKPPAGEYRYFSRLFRNDFYHMEGLDQMVAAGFLDKILAEIRVEYGFDFSTDQEFCKEMMAQLIGTLKRDKNSQYVVNPVLFRIKAQYPLEYDIAIFFADRFNQLAGCAIGEDEVGLIAIHFIRAMETNMMRHEKKVALVNPFGKQVKDLIKKRLEEMGECRIKIGYTYSIFDLPVFFPEDILAVLTTVPLPENPEDVPVILCHNFLDYYEKEKLLTAVREDQVTSVRTYFQNLFRPSLFFPDMEFDSKEQALAFMCGKLCAQGYVEENFLESVMQREAIAPTAFESGFAFAHAMENMARRTAICTCLLKNKLPWGEYNVRILFLFALSPTWNHRVIPVYNVMIDNLMKAGAVRRLSHIKTCQEFVKMLL